MPFPTLGEAVPAQGNHISRSLGKAVLILHSPVDEIVDVDHARHIYQAARHPKSFISLDRADHLLSRQADSEYVAELIGAWATRYLGSKRDRSSRTNNDNKTKNANP